VTEQLRPVIRVFVDALGVILDDSEVDDEIEHAASYGDEWCRECMGNGAAGLNAARLVVPAVLRWAADLVERPGGVALLRAEADKIEAGEVKL
jgi:hypothetical protein